MKHYPRTRIAIADLDQTLLREDKSISGRSIAAIRACQASGIRFGIATARSVQSARRYTDVIKPDFAITNGGALAIIGDESPWRRPLSPDQSVTLLKTLRTHPYVSKITMETGSGYWANFHHGDDPDYAHARYSDFSDFTPTSVLKITVESANHAAMAALAAGINACSCISFSGEPWYRFSHADATKWKAAEAVIAHYGFTPDEACAFGDDLIDLELVSRVGLGVAVANGIPEIRAAAKLVTGSNDEDGVAVILENVAEGR